MVRASAPVVCQVMASGAGEPPDGHRRLRCRTLQREVTCGSDAWAPGANLIGSQSAYSQLARAQDGASDDRVTPAQGKAAPRSPMKYWASNDRRCSPTVK